MLVLVLVLAVAVAVAVASVVAAAVVVSNGVHMCVYVLAHRVNANHTAKTHVPADMEHSAQHTCLRTSTLVKIHGVNIIIGAQVQR